MKKTFGSNMVNISTIEKKYKVVIKEDNSIKYEDLNDGYYIMYLYDQLYIFKNIIDFSNNQEKITQIEIFNQKFDISYYTPTEEEMMMSGAFYNAYYAYDINDKDSFGTFMKEKANDNQVVAFFRDKRDELPYGGYVYFSNNQAQTLLQFI